MNDITSRWKLNIAIEKIIKWKLFHISTQCGYFGPMFCCRGGIFIWSAICPYSLTAHLRTNFRRSLAIFAGYSQQLEKKSNFVPESHINVSLIGIFKVIFKSSVDFVLFCDLPLSFLWKIEQVCIKLCYFHHVHVVRYSSCHL